MEKATGYIDSYVTQIIKHRLPGVDRAVHLQPDEILQKSSVICVNIFIGVCLVHCKQFSKYQKNCSLHHAVFFFFNTLVTVGVSRN